MTARRAPLAPPDLAGVTHRPTRELAATLYEYGWQLVRGVAEPGGRATLIHPDRPGDMITVWVGYHDPSRVAEVWVNGERKLISRTIEFIREG